MKRAAAAAAAFSLIWTPAASARTHPSAQLLLRGITHAVAMHWVKAPDAARYRRDVNRALWDERRLPPLRARVIESQLVQLTTLWDSYTSPRALALFTQLEQNLAYFETHRIPAERVDVSDGEGVVYRWFPNKGLEFHPLASFSALANAAGAHDVEKTQALARAGALLGDARLTAAAGRAYAAVPPLVFETAWGPWIRLYGFDREVVLNAQLQTVISLLEYGQTTGDTGATALAQRLEATAKALFPRFDTGDWSLYELRGGHASLSYQQYVTTLLSRLGGLTKDPYWVDAALRFQDYLGAPKVTEGTPPPTIYPQPQDGWLDVASIPITLSQRSSVTLAVGGKVFTYRLGRGMHVLTWTPPPTLAPGTYPVTVSAISYVGLRARVHLEPVVVAWDTAAPQNLQAQLSGATLTWQADDPGTPSVHLVLQLVDPAGVNPPQTVDLGEQPVSGTAQVSIPPGTWQATLAATNSAGQTATLDLGTVSA